MPSDDTIGVGGDFTTIAAWEASLPATLSGLHIGRLLNQVFNETLLIDGHTATPTDYIELTAAPGASFADDDTNALRYDEGQGAAISGFQNYAYAFVVETDYTRINRIQFEQTGGNGRQTLDLSGDDNRLERCIIKGQMIGNFWNELGGFNAIVTNCLFYDIAPQPTLLRPRMGTSYLDYNTLAFPVNLTSTNRTLQWTYHNVVSNNGAHFGGNNGYAYGVSESGVTNATDVNEAIDASDLLNVPYSATTPFVQADNTLPLDFKLADPSPLRGAGTPVSVTIDIFGNTRDAVNPSIGCWEPVSVAPVTAQNPIMHGAEF